LGATDTPSRQRLASTTGYQPKQDSARDLPLVLAKRPARSVGVAAHCAADTAAPLVGGERESRAFSFAPDIDEGRRKKRQPTRLARAVGDEGIDERRLHLEAGPLGRTFDRTAELGGGQWPEQDLVRPDEVGQLDVW